MLLRSPLVTAHLADIALANTGIHPHWATDYKGDATYAQLRDLAKLPEVVAIGETGLDFNRNKSTQLALFRPFLVYTRE
jgi:TatD DNase family protein